MFYYYGKIINVVGLLILLRELLRFLDLLLGNIYYNKQQDDQTFKIFIWFNNSTILCYSIINVSVNLIDI